MLDQLASALPLHRPSDGVAAAGRALATAATCPSDPTSATTVTPTGDSEAGFSLISEHSREASAGKLADVVGAEREDNDRGRSNGSGDASANSDLRALIAQARELLFERQVEQALTVSDRLLRLVEPGAEPASLEAAALPEHARSLMYLVQSGSDAWAESPSREPAYQTGAAPKAGHCLGFGYLHLGGVHGVHLASRLN